MKFEEKRKRCMVRRKDSLKFGGAVGQVVVPKFLLTY
jgi:hypothetical protein